MSNAITVPTYHLRFVKKKFQNSNLQGEPFEEYKFRLQQRWDTTTLIEGKWEVTSIWKDVQVEEQNV